MKYLPIYLDLRDRLCLVVGGGRVGQRKVLTLLECGARVRLVSRETTAELRDLIDSGRIEQAGQSYSPEHLESVALVFVCTDDAWLNRRIFREASDQGIEVNVADQPDLCSFIMPAVISQGDLTISVSTSGSSPALASRIRQRLETLFGPEYAQGLDLMARIRTRVLEEGGPDQENRDRFYGLIDAGLIEALAEKDRLRVERIIADALGPDCTLAVLGFEMEEGSET